MLRRFEEPNALLRALVARLGPQWDRSSCSRGETETTVDTEPERWRPAPGFVRYYEVTRKAASALWNESWSSGADGVNRSGAASAQCT
jgi:hypothetical protein